MAQYDNLRSKCFIYDDPTELALLQLTQQLDELMDAIHSINCLKSGRSRS